MSFKRNNLILPVAAALIIIFSSCGKENKTADTETKNEQTTTANPQELKEADKFVVHYDMQGMMRGTMDIMRNGNKLKQVINSNVMGLNTVNTIFILDNVAYSVTEAAGQKFVNKSDIKEYNNKKQTGETIVDFKEFEKFLSGKKITGNENLLGYNCDVFDVGGGLTMSVYNKKYILKINSPEFIAVANKIDLNPVFAANEFDLPQNVDFNNPSKTGMDAKTLDSLVKEKTKK